MDRGIWKWREREIMESSKRSEWDAYEDIKIEMDEDRSEKDREWVERRCSYKLLLCKLKTYGIRNEACDLIKSYFCNRKQSQKW